MEGVTDASFREALTALGGIDMCVTEFLRVTRQLHPKKIFHRYLPELTQQCQTRSGTPVILQLLGSDPEFMLLNAQRAIDLGVKGIDINFGCPAKIVNRHMGGSVLLNYPEKIFEISNTLRKNLPKHISVSAKIRLGYEDTLLLNENLKAIEESKMDWLTVHCRTKKNGYAPPAYWEYIPSIKEQIKTKIIVNGDIFNFNDLLKCHSVCDHDHYMIGRGTLFNPLIFKEILIQRNLLSKISDSEYSPQIREKELHSMLEVLKTYYSLAESEVNEYYATAKLKGWLKSISIKNPELKEPFNQLKALTVPDFYNQFTKLNI